MSIIRKPWFFAAPALLLFAFACGGNGDGGEDPGTDGDGEVVIPVPSPFPGISSEVVVANAAAPTALAFAPDGRLFYTERDTGNVRIVTADGQLLPEPFAQIEVAAAPGWGLLGLALDPEFETNQYVYVYYTEPVEGREVKTAKPVLMRFTDANGRGEDPTTLIDDLPEAEVFGEYFVGGQMRFGPDGYLYITVGDHTTTVFAQDLSSPRGKVLRINKEDGSAAPDNPFVDDPDADPRVFAYGFLNAPDLAFDPQTGDLFASENGIYFCCDELNLVRSGQNYGWPDSGPTQGGVLPIHFFAFPDQVPEGSKVRPTGIQFASGDVYPALGDSLLSCESDTRYMRRLVLAPGQDEVQSDDVVIADCRLDIAASPDGIIYYSNDNEIRRLVAEEVGQATPTPAEGASPTPAATP